MKTIYSSVIAFVLVSLGFLPLAMAADAAKPAPATTTATGKSESSATSGNQTAKPTSPSYLLRIRDVITVNVADDPRAVQDYKIEKDGTSQMMYMEGPIKLAGLSVQEAIKAVHDEYVKQKIFKDPQITIAIKAYAPIRINVIGAVARPGWVEIAPDEDITVKNVLSQAGGPTRNASRYITITRILPNGKSETIPKFDAKAAWEDAKNDTTLYDGDSIHMGESYLGDSWF